MKIFIFLSYIFCAFSSCAQDRGQGCKFDLFKGTLNDKLAKAVANDDEKKSMN